MPGHGVNRPTARQCQRRARRDASLRKQRLCRKFPLRHGRHDPPGQVHPRERHHHLGREIRVAACVGALECGQEVVVVRLVKARAGDLGLVIERVHDLGVEGGHRVAMAALHLRAFTVGAQLLEREQTHRLEQAIARRIARLDLHQRLGDERREQVEDTGCRDIASSADALRRIQAETPHECGQAPQRDFLRVG